MSRIGGYGYQSVPSWLRSQARAVCGAGKTVLFILAMVLRHPGQSGAVEVWSDGKVTFGPDRGFACAVCGKTITWKQAKTSPVRSGTREWFRCPDCDAADRRPSLPRLAP